MNKIGLWGIALMAIFSESATFAQTTFERAFIAAATQEKHLDSDLAQKWLLPLAENMPTFPAAATAEQALGQLDQQFSLLTPNKLYLSKISTKEVALFQFKTPQTPLTVVIFPGVFGEFIETRAFSEVFDNLHSNAQRAWQKVLQAQSACQVGTEPGCDFHLLLKQVGIAGQSPYRVASLDELLSVGSIDDSQGRPLVQVVLFNTPTLSTESLGSIEDRAEIFGRRLQKYIDLMKPQRLAFLGYSRGSMVALELLARAKEKGTPWLSRVEAMTSLGGVNFGSALADDVVNVQNQNPPPQSAQQVALLMQLSDHLQELQNGVPDQQNARLKNANRLLWAQTALVMLKQSNLETLKNLWDQLLNQVNPTSGYALDRFAPLILKMATNYGLTPSLSDDLEPQSVVDYNRNVTRLKTFINSVYIAITQLSTPARLKWWRENEIPTQCIRYLSINATLAEPDQTPYGQLINSQNQLFELRTPDALTLQSGYRDFQKISQMAVNDSQVAAQRAMFWPELVAQLNPQNTGMQATHLATLGVSHWGLALRVVYQDRKGLVNPMARRALLLALAAHLDELQK
jgi:pimeloyl-ACP methyl ester carboxylesterase